jgi:hypothetical protein
MLSGGVKADFVRANGCVLRGMGGCGLIGSIDAAHVRSRGAGGDSRDLVGLCTRHHAEQHAIGILSFQERYDIDLKAKAEELEMRWRSLEAGTTQESEK